MENYILNDLRPVSHLTFLFSTPSHRLLLRFSMQNKEASKSCSIGWWLQTAIILFLPLRKTGGAPGLLYYLGFGVFFASSLLPSLPSFLPFPSSLPPSLSFPLSLLSLPFSLSLSCIQGWHSEPLCIYVHNKAARPLHFICIITISVQAHHIVCCLHLLLRLLSQSTRLDFHILNELILYQHNARSHPRRWERGSSARSSAPLLRHRTPRKVWWGGGALCGVNYGY